MRHHGVAATMLMAGLLWVGVTHAVDEGPEYPDNIHVQPYEPMRFGYTKDNDDVGYLDFTLSLKYRFVPLWVTGPDNPIFATFTGRFGFYVDTRPSSPVIGKSYNPKILWRHILERPKGSGDDRPQAPREILQYLDFAYAHESNGQSIINAQEFQAAQLASPRPQFANAYISRGWDYLEMVWKKSYGESSVWSSYLDLRYFLIHGLFQGLAEEYHSFENDPQGKPRRAVDGLTGLVEYQDNWSTSKDQFLVVSRRFAAVKYQTGYDTPFKYSTVRLEAGAQLGIVPVVVWVQNGYMSDLANYYRKVTSVGVEIRVPAF